MEVLRREDWLPPWSALVALQPRGKRPPFVCVHPRGGEVLVYRDLTLHLGEDQPFYSFQAPIGQSGEDFSRNVETMAAAYVRELRQFQPRGPYYLGGYSFGGIVAFEMAQRLVAEGETIALLALIETGGATEQSGRLTRLRETGRRLTRLRPSARLPYLWEEFRALRGRLRRSLWLATHRAPAGPGRSDLALVVPREMRGGGGMRGRIAMSDYWARPYPGQVTLFRGAERLGRDARDPFLGWDRVALAGFVFEEVPGNHFTLIKEPHVRTLAQRLRFRLELAQAGVHVGPNGRSR